MRKVRGALGVVWCISMMLAGCDRPAPGNSAQTTTVSTTSSQAASPQQPAAPVGPQRPHDPNAPPAVPVHGAPPIKFEPDPLDLGVVRPNERHTGTIYIQNTSDKPIKIVNTKASCTCTSVDLSNTIVAAGERIPMQADYHSGSTMGSKDSAIRVLVEGFDITEVRIRALVTLPVRAEPSFILSQPDPNGVPVLSGEYIVDSMDKRPFKILAVNGGKVPYADGFDPARDTPRNSYKLKWDFSGYDQKTCVDSGGNRLPAWVAIETDHPECPILDLEVRHECVRRALPNFKTETWMIQDKRALIGGVKPGEYADFEVLAKWFKPQVNHDVINAVVVESNQFTAELLSAEKVQDGVLCKVRVTVNPGQTGLIYGTLQMKSARQSAPMIIVGTAR